VRRVIVTSMLAAVMAAVATRGGPAQRSGPLTDEAEAERWKVENELASLAIIERKVIPMRDR